MTCCYCGYPLDNSPSMYFCRVLCQESWYAERADLLTAAEEYAGMSM